MDSKTMSDVSTASMPQLTAPPTAAAIEALQAMLNQAQQNSLAGHWSAVIGLCEAAIAQCRLHLHDEAQSSLVPETELQSPALANNYNPVALYRAKGDVLKREGQIDAAIQAYQQAVKHDPQQAELQAQLADLYAQQRHWEAAIAHYRHAFDLDATLQKGDVAIKLAVLYTRQQQWENAITCYGKALPLKAKPQQAELEFRIAELYAHHQQWDRAREHYQAALKLNPDLVKANAGLGQTYLQIGHQQRQLGNPDEAVQAYLQAIAYQPDLGEPYNQLRYNLMRYDIPANSTLLDNVVSTCRQIAQENPQFVPAHVTLAYALTRQGEIAAATDCYRTISDRIPPRPQTSSSQTSPSQTSPWEQAERRGPDFIIIGAEKCGTSSLYHYLRRHPAMLPPIEKEIDFFDEEYDRGLDWYLAHFPPIPQQPGWMTGETSPNYLYSDVAPERVHRHFPQTKLIAILRNPVDRTVSRFNMMVRNGTEKRSFEVAIAEEMSQIQLEIDRHGEELRPSMLNWHRHIGNSLYYYHLKHWLDYFPREQLLVLKSEDLFEQPESTLQKLYSELGLKHHSEQEYPKHNSGRYQPIDLGLYQTLSEFFKPHTQRLERYLDQSFDW